MRIAIIGAGMAGLATASLFADQSHDISVFDQLNAPNPWTPALSSSRSANTFWRKSARSTTRSATATASHVCGTMLPAVGRL